MRLTVRDFMSTHKARYAQLCDQDLGGVPLFYPTLYGSLRLWLKPQNTQREILHSIQRLYEWAEQRGIDLDERFASRMLLTPYEIDSLGDFLLRKKNATNQPIRGSKFNARCRHIYRYLEWLAPTLIEHSNAEIGANIGRMLASIDALKKPIASSHQRHRDMLAKHLAEPARDALIALFNNPTEGIARSAHHGAAIRNAVMLEILYETGMRVGELLSLKLKDFTPARGGDHATLVIRRNHDDPFDRRLRQPVAKTLGRHIGITEHLSRRIQSYLRETRANVPNVEFTD
ncbi:TPA: site-specific integrase, partial [Pseudomonas aeruginosa]|nr:site-specific integrase [Pseudomonas aeruginosa]